MLIPQIQITQEFCNEITIKDITPAYSPTTPGGYGGLNVDADEITLAKVTMDFGPGRTFVYETPYNQTKEDIIIESRNFTLSPATESTCGSCGHTEIEADEFGYMSQFPSGCINITFQLYSNDSTNSAVKKLEGTKVAKFVSLCSIEERFLDLADKITNPNARGFYDMNPDHRLDIMRNFALLWTKLEQLKYSDGCDCDCLAGKAKQAEVYLKSIRAYGT